MKNVGWKIHVAPPSNFRQPVVNRGAHIGPAWSMGWLRSMCKWLNSYHIIRGASHYGWRSRGRRFPPIKLQETKSSTSQVFTVWPRFKGLHNIKLLFSEEGDGLSKKVWVISYGNGTPNYGREVIKIFPLKNQSLTISWPLDWRDYFEQGIKWDAPLGLAFGGLTLCQAKCHHLLYIICYF
jgi:hypothetical protein